MSSYRDLEIYKTAYDLAIQVHNLSMKLPQFELYEQGSQIRRSAFRIKDTIAEGYGRRRYKQEYIRYLVFAHASCDETTNHLTTLCELYPDIKGFSDCNAMYELLGRKINKYIQFVEDKWNTAYEPQP
ncbi:MAG: four helix bundle protein [Bacteroidales bacterium]